MHNASVPLMVLCLSRYESDACLLILDALESRQVILAKHVAAGADLPPAMAELQDADPQYLFPAVELANENGCRSVN